GNAVDARALRDRHLRLGNGADARDVDRRAAEEMQDAHAAVVALLTHLDELIRRALKPGRHHVPVIMPDSAEAVPHQRVAPNRPILDQVADGAPVFGFAGTHAVLAASICDRKEVDLARRRLRWQVCEPAWLLRGSIPALPYGGYIGWDDT